MAAVLLAAAGGSGALAGFAAGVAGAALGDAPGWVPPALVLTAVAADAAYLTADRPRPWSVGRQVPREWSALFAPPTVALLYGARLGVGPLTILVTWLWWAALAVGALAGPAAATIAGAVFGGVRALTMLAVAEWARPAMAPRIGRLRRAERPVAAAVLLAAAAVLL